MGGKNEHFKLWNGYGNNWGSFCEYIKFWVIKIKHINQICVLLIKTLHYTIEIKQVIEIVLVLCKNL